MPAPGSDIVLVLGVQAMESPQDIEKKFNGEKKKKKKGGFTVKHIQPTEHIL